MSVPGKALLYSTDIAPFAPHACFTVCRAPYPAASLGGDASDTNSLLSSQLTGMEFGGSLDVGAARPDLAGSSLSASGSTFYSERPTTLLKSTESLVSVTSGSKPPSVKSNISLTPPSRSAGNLSHLYGSHLETGKRLAVGLLIVVVIALSWVGSTQTAKSSLTNKTHFNSPFFVMWFGTGWMMAVYPLSCIVFFLVHRDRWNRKGVRELWR